MSLIFTWIKLKKVVVLDQRESRGIDEQVKGIFKKKKMRFGWIRVSGLRGWAFILALTPRESG